jgi:hypothetical protein
VGRPIDEPLRCRVVFLPCEEDDEVKGRYDQKLGERRPTVSMLEVRDIGGDLI